MIADADGAGALAHAEPFVGLGEKEIVGNVGSHDAGAAVCEPEGERQAGITTPRATRESGEGVLGCAAGW